MRNEIGTSIVVGLLGAVGGYWAAGGGGVEPRATVEEPIEQRLADQLAEDTSTASGGVGLDGIAEAFGVVASVPDAARRALAAFELVGRLDAEALEFAATELDLESAHGAMAGTLKLAISDRWSEVDPEGWREHIEANYSPMVFREIGMFAQRDYEAASQILDRNEPWSDYMHEFYYGFAMGDPEGALRMYLDRDGIYAQTIFEAAGSRISDLFDTVNAVPPGETRSELTWQMFREWGHREPVEGLGAALRLVDAAERDSVIVTWFMERVAKRDPSAAAAAFEELSEQAQREAAPELFAGWASHDHRGAMRWAVGALDPEVLGPLMLEAGATADPELVMETVARMSDEQRGEYLGRLEIGDFHCFIHRLAERDARAAVDWLNANDLLKAQLGEESENDRTSSGIEIAEAAFRNGGLEGAAALARDLPEGSFRRGFVESLANQLGSADPGAGLAWAASLPGEEGRVAVAEVAEGWVSVDPVAAAQWAFAGQGYEVTTLGAWGREDAEGAYRWLAGEIGSEPERVDELVRDSQLFESWAEQDPVAAATAALGFGERSAAGHLQGVVERWAADTPAAAGRFIDGQLVAGAERDAAVAALVDAIKGEQVEAALAWAETISDDSMRVEVMSSLPPPVD